jgi:hypothetical protein
METKIIYNALLVKRLGYVALFFSWVFLIEYTARMIWWNFVPKGGQFFCVGNLGFLGLLAIVISGCLKNLEDKLSSQQKKDDQEGSESNK